MYVLRLSKLLAGFCLGATVLFLPLTTQHAASNTPARPVSYAARAVGFAESIAIRDLPPVTKTGSNSEQEKDGSEKNPENREIIRHIDPRVKKSVDTAVSSDANSSSRHLKSPQAIALPTPSVSFDGISQADTIAADSSQGFLPPDTNGEVGPNHYVQTVNSCFRIWNKAGTPLVATQSLAALFSPLGCGDSIDGDPIVLYDQLADRWIISEFCTVASPNNHQLIAVSKTPDPTGAYYLYDFMMPNNKFNDYPHFGAWSDGYYMTDNQFNQAGTAFQQSGVFAFDRVKMLSGDPTASFVYFDTAVLFPPGGVNGTDGIGGMLPADLDGFRPPPAGGPCPFVYFQADEFGDPGDRLRIFDFHADFTTPANSTFTERSGSPLNVAAFDPDTVPADSRNVVPQPSPATTDSYLDAISDRIMFRLAYRNLGSTESLVLNHTVNAATNPSYRAGVRFYQLNRTTPAGAFTIAEQQTWAGPGGDTLHRWMGSGAMNFQGDVAVGYSVSSASNPVVFPSVRYAARLGTDPVGTGLAQGEAIIVAGGGSQTSTSGRWGDYSDMTVDPSDDCTFWFTQEYYTASSGSGWKTRVAKFVAGTQATSPRGTISGTVTNCSSGLPVANAIVQISGGYYRQTAADGTYSAVVVPGTYDVTIAGSGYDTATVNGVVVSNGGNGTASACINGNLKQPVADSGSVTADSCNSNGIIDPNESVTVSLGIKNTGTLATSNLVATLQASGGVTNPSGPQSYGAVTPGGATVFKSFTFTSGNVSCGSTVVATLQLQDGATNLGTITYNFATGVVNVAFTQNFDGVAAPALPSGWSATNASGTTLWVTSTTTPDTAPNDAFIDDPATVSDKRLDSPGIAITSPNAQVTFRHNYNVEDTFDGCVLEVSSPNINGGTFTDITNAAVGGSFVMGGYTDTISSGFSNPVGGRQAWSGSSGGYITTVANLGPNVAGQTIKLRFRIGTDTIGSGVGWRVDTIQVSNGNLCCGNLIAAAPPAVLTAENFTPANGAPDPGEYATVNLSVRNLGASNTTNLVGTLQPTGGVTSPSAPQAYGVVAGGGSSVTKSFSFIANGTCGTDLTLTLALHDGAQDLGTVTYPLRLGATSAVSALTQNFDGVSAPALPAGWTTAATGGEAAWVTNTTNPNSAPNSAFASEGATVGNTELISPSIAVAAGGGQVTFRIAYNLEASSTPTIGYDGAVLEISINGGAYADITSGGNSFIAGGYTRTISSSFSNPLGGRMAWSGLSGGTTATPSYITSTINFPAAAAGQNIRLKWRVASDSDTVASGSPGVRVDNISVTTNSPVCTSNQAPQIVNGPPPSPVVVGSPYSFAFGASGNPAPTFSYTGVLPPGLNLSAAGVLSGTVTSGGTGAFPGITVTATNGVNPDATQSFSLSAVTTAANYLASNGLSGANAVLTFDVEGDGSSNLLEYGLGMDPTVASLTGLPVVTLKDYSGTKYLSMTFNRSSLATDITYIVQSSNDFVTWTDLGTSAAGAVTSGPGFVGETGPAPTFAVEVRDTTAQAAGAKRWMRLKITSP